MLSTPLSADASSCVQARGVDEPAAFGASGSAMIATGKANMTGSVHSIADERRARNQRMRAMDLERLKAKATSGALETEQLEALVAKLGTSFVMRRALRTHRLLLVLPQYHYCVLDAFVACRPWRAALDMLAAERNIESSDAAAVLRDIESKASMVAELDVQLQRKAARAAAERQEEAAHVQQMLEAQHEQAQREAAEQARRAALNGQLAATLRAQREEREQKRLVELEAREQEAARLVAFAQKQQQEALAAQEAKRRAAREAGLATARANEMFAARDALRRARDEAEEREILRYQLEKDAREAEAERQREQARAEKERLWAQLRASQQRVADNRAAEDEARARRAQEAKILADRAASAAAKARKEASKQEVLAALRAQQELKARLRAEEEQQERAAAAATAAVQAADMQRELEEAAAVRRRAAAAAAELAAQKEARDQARRDAVQTQFEERRALALQAQANAVVVERLRQRAVARMEATKNGARPLPDAFVKIARTVPLPGSGAVK